MKLLATHPGVSQKVPPGDTLFGKAKNIWCVPTKEQEFYNSSR